MIADDCRRSQTLLRSAIRDHMETSLNGSLRLYMFLNDTNNPKGALFSVTSIISFEQTLYA